MAEIVSLQKIGGGSSGAPLESGGGAGASPGDQKALGSALRGEVPVPLACLVKKKALGHSTSVGNLKSGSKPNC